MQNLTINIPSRIHLNLIAMHACDFRRNGGFGISVDTGLVLHAKKCEEIIIGATLPELKPLIKKLENLLLSIKMQLELNSGVYLTLANGLPPHIGLGSGTSITLAAIEALLIVNGYKYTNQVIQRLSGRGGTSGVGIHTYFTGGFVYDIGTKADTKAHLPSSYTAPKNIPPLLLREAYPFGDITFIYPNYSTKTYGEDEYNFFLKSTPIPDMEAQKACYNSIFEITASLIDCDKLSFFRAVDKIKRTKWKKLEIEHSSKITSKVLSDLEKLRISGVGMSSMGPGIYIMSQKNLDLLPNILERFKFNTILLKPNNTGRTFSYA